MAGSIRMHTLEFPIGLVNKCSGFALDIGGSVVKFVYRSKADWEKAQANKDAKTCPMHLLTCGRPDLDAALAKVKQEAHITREEGQTTKVYSCGVGGYQMNDKLTEALDVDLENVPEFDCVVEGLAFMLRTIPQDQLLYPMLTEIENEHITREKALLDTWLEVGKKTTHRLMKDDFTIVYPKEFPLSSDRSMSEVLGDDAMYPLMMMQLGSAYAIMKFANGESAQLCDISDNGGRHFMGIASLLTGIKTYDEFIDLAEKGDKANVSQTLFSMVKRDDEGNDDPYAAITTAKTDNVVFSFGHAVFQNLDKFKKEDLAAAWLVSHISEIARTIHYVCVMHGVKHFLVCGSFANRASVREHMVRELVHRDCQMVMSYNKQFLPRLLFMKDGGHTGAVGALINSVSKFTKDRGQPVE